MKYSVKHGLPNRQQVRDVVEKAYHAYEERLGEYSPTLEWHNDHRAEIKFSIMSQSIAAFVEFDDEQLRIDGRIPLIFKPFQKKIESVLSEELERWLKKARSDLARP